jgi:hypothetical protein
MKQKITMLSSKGRPRAGNLSNDLIMLIFKGNVVNMQQSVMDDKAKQPSNRSAHSKQTNRCVTKKENLQPNKNQRG